MKTRMIWTIAIAFLAIVPASAADERPHRNAEITLTAIDRLPSGEKIESRYTLVARLGKKLELQTNWSIPPAEIKSGETERAKNKKFSYQSSGISLSLTTGQGKMNRVWVTGYISLQNMEMHPGHEDVAMNGGHRYTFSLILPENKPIRAVEIPRLDGGSIVIKLEAELL